MKSLELNLGLAIKIDVEAMSVAYNTRRRLMTSMNPGTSTYKLVFGVDLVKSGTLPMNSYLD
jgi:hypothetical protein